ncbi:CPBP family intramembrane glutamic endopeptidase [Luethyella okanaganae]|uniref:CPBP family intramembrane glutamic endopeptidase n=1 Tax=Luethyella okanaganae TaxID=69372 RepID=A0ABW1VCS7_9MICO
MDTVDTQPETHPETLSTGPRLGLGPLGITVRIVVAIVILLGANLVVVGLSALLALVPGNLLSEATPTSLTVFVLMQACMPAIVVLAGWAWMRLVERRGIRDAGWRWTASSAGWLLLAIIVAGGLVIAAVAMLPSTGPVAGTANHGSSAPIAFSLIALVSQSFLLQAIPEELLFRGWLLSTLRARPILAITVTTLSFTVVHLASNGGQETLAERLLYLAPPFGFSLLAVGMLLWTGSLWSAVGVHGGLHLGNTAATVLLPEVDAALSWVVIGALHTAVGAALIISALRHHRVILKP